MTHSCHTEKEATLGTASYCEPWALAAETMSGACGTLTLLLLVVAFCLTVLRYGESKADVHARQLPRLQTVPSALT